MKSWFKTVEKPFVQVCWVKFKYRRKLNIVFKNILVVLKPFWYKWCCVYLCHL